MRWAYPLSPRGILHHHLVEIGVRRAELVVEQRDVRREAVAHEMLALPKDLTDTIAFGITIAVPRIGSVWRTAPL